MSTPTSFTEERFVQLCDALAQTDPHIRAILEAHGYPPVFTREPNFETLIHIVLEQQVSLASAKAALLKLKEKIGVITPRKLLRLSDEELRACYFSRQKAGYARNIARAIVEEGLSLQRLASLADEEVRSTLTRIKGIGNWTVDVFLMMALHRTDLFPTGDIALMNIVRHNKSLPSHTPAEHILALADAWRPNRTVAAFVFWHEYIQRKGIRL